MYWTGNALVLTALALFWLAWGAQGLEGMLLGYYPDTDQDGVVDTNACPGYISQENAGALFVYFLGTGHKVYVEEDGVLSGSFSPDGSRIAYQKANQVWVCDVDGNNRQAVTACGTGDAVTWGSDYIYWSELTSAVYQVKEDGSERGVLHDFGQTVYKAGVSQDGTHVSGFAMPGPWIIAWDSATNTTSNVACCNFGGGCRGTFSPDGSMVTRNRSNHNDWDIIAYSPGDPINGWPGIQHIDNINWEPCAGRTDGKATFNMHRFSTKSNDFVVLTGEGANSAYVYQLSTRQFHYICRGIALDFCPFSPFNSVPAPAFAPQQGTFADAIDVTITGTGTIRYTTDASDPTDMSLPYAGPVHLTATTTIKARCFSGDDQSSIASKTYTKAAAGAQLTAIQLAPATMDVAGGGRVHYTATALDQNGAEMQDVSFTWSVDGGGTIDTAGLLKAGMMEGGPYTVRVSSGGVHASATFSVQGTICLIEPQAAARYREGDTMHVRWEWTGADTYPGGVVVSFSNDGGLSLHDITGTNSIASGDAAWGDLTWVIGQGLPDGVSVQTQKGVVQIGRYAATGLAWNGTTSEPFTVLAKDAATIPSPPSKSSRAAIRAVRDALLVTIPYRGYLEIEVNDTRGRRVFCEAVRGAGTRRIEKRLAPGAWMVCVRIDGRCLTSALITAR
ncbi:MAG: hypothetical protein GF418_13480 [Chitinivibrionales bacterium]|nr:hypothetical protein [Chitinivibrionales bacterium]MBD3396631.1 hypothetical protein [Chitinivibrionales bacterium]